MRALAQRVVDSHNDLLRFLVFDHWPVYLTALLLFGVYSLARGYKENRWTLVADVLFGIFWSLGFLLPVLLTVTLLPMISAIAKDEIGWFAWLVIALGVWMAAGWGYQTGQQSGKRWGWLAFVAGLLLVWIVGGWVAIIDTLGPIPDEIAYRRP